MESIGDIFESQRDDKRRATHLADGLTLPMVRQRDFGFGGNDVNSGGVRIASLARPGDQRA